MKRLLATCLFSGLILATVVAFGDAKSATKVGDFTLQDYLGAKHSLTEWKDKQAIVVVFLGTECPLAKLYATRLAELDAEYSRQGRAFVGINSNQQDSLLRDRPLRPRAQDRLSDAEGLGGRRRRSFGASARPRRSCSTQRATFSITAASTISSASAIAARTACEHDLADALDELLAGKPVSTPSTEPVGCFIGRSDTQAADTATSPTRSTSRAIIDKHCVRCHRAGPDRAVHADFVRRRRRVGRDDARSDRRGPHAAVARESRRTATSRTTPACRTATSSCFASGSTTACPRATRPTARAAEVRRRLADSEAGRRLHMPEAVHRARQGHRADYQYFKFDPDVRRGRVDSRRPRCGRAIRRSCITRFVFYVPPGQDDIRGEDPLLNSIAAFAPGMPAALWPDGYARFVPAGSKLVFQVHYTPNGSEQTDQSEVGLVFADPKSSGRRK